MLAILYLSAAVGVGAVVWSHTRGTWSSGSLGSHITRCVLFTAITAALWPATRLVVLAYHIPAARKAIHRVIIPDDDG